MRRVDKSTLPETEEGIQQRIVQFLQIHGFIVKSTVRRRKRCWKCGVHPRGGDGVTQGIGDLLVVIPRLRTLQTARRIMINADVKTASGKLTDEQSGAAVGGELLIWRDHEQALADCERIEKALSASICRLSREELDRDAQQAEAL
jgi:hypothetical protein